MSDIATVHTEQLGAADALPRCQVVVGRTRQLSSAITRLPSSIDHAIEGCQDVFAVHPAV